MGGGYLGLGSKEGGFWPLSFSVNWFEAQHKHGFVRKDGSITFYAGTFFPPPPFRQADEGLFRVSYVTNAVLAPPHPQIVRREK